MSDSAFDTPSQRETYVLRGRSTTAKWFGRRTAGRDEAGFVRIDASASYDSYGTPEATALWASRFGEERPEDHPAVQIGLVDSHTIKQIDEAWKKWGQDPDAFLARPWCEAVGWKDARCAA